MSSSLSLAQKPLSSSESALIDLTRVLRHDLDQVNALILDRSQSPVELIPQVATHLIASGGKRLRPLLTLASCQVFGYQGEHHIKLATAVEFIHTATLLHDDVVDESGLRRGKKTAHTLWGNETSILVGDFLFAQAFKLMVETQSLQALDTLSSAATTITQGEVKQMMIKNDLSISPAIYQDIITSKTAALFKAACEIGAILTNQPPQVRANMADYGQNLGLLFQITDDILDYFGSADKMGKSLGDDFKEGKVTLPVILTYLGANHTEKEFLQACFEKLNQAPEDFEGIISLMRRKGIYQKCRHQAYIYADKAKEALNAIDSSNPTKDILMTLPDYCLERVG